MKPSIVVIGSSNTDMVIKADHLPAAGETIIGGSFFMNQGGKGANQAVAAARLGGNVSLIAKTGNDIFGHQALQHFKQEGINTSYVFTDSKHPSGVALITVDRNGENCIVVASGANASLLPDDLKKSKEVIKKAAIVLVQLEIPLITVEYIAALAADSGVTLLLNPAPACQLSDSLLQYISIITPNQKEAEMLTGVAVVDLQSAQQAAKELYNKGIEKVIITLGSEGALVLNDGKFIHVPSLTVNAVDATGAGDVFNGALAVALSEGSDFVEATSFACKAAAISVTRIGAQQSAPYRKEIESFAGVTNSVN